MADEGAVHRPAGGKPPRPDSDSEPRFNDADGPGGEQQGQGKEALALLETIRAFIGRHQAATDALEDEHLDHCIDEVQDGSERHTLSPFLPTKPDDVAAFLGGLDVSPETLILDLGCGDGRVLTAAALARGCRGVGVDISEACIQLARSVAAAEGVGPGLVGFHRLDLLQEDDALAFLEKEAQARLTADCGRVIVFLYVYPTLLARLGSLVQRLVARLHDLGEKPRVVTLTYHFEHDLAAMRRRRLGKEDEGGSRFEVHS